MSDCCSCSCPSVVCTAALSVSRADCSNFHKEWRSGIPERVPIHSTLVYLYGPHEEETTNRTCEYRTRLTVVYFLLSCTYAEVLEKLLLDIKLSCNLSSAAISKGIEQLLNETSIK